MPHSLKWSGCSRRSAVRTGSYLICTIVTRPTLRERQTAKHVARFEVVRRAVPVSSDYDVSPTARSYISEFLHARLPKRLNGAAAPGGPPALLRVRLLGQPHRGLG